MEQAGSPKPKPDTSTFRMHYRGDQHRIGANTFAVSLLSTNQVIASINNRLGANRKLRVEVNTPSRGSFEVELTLSAAEVGNAFGDAFSYTDGVLGTLVAILELYRFQSTHSVEEVEEGSNTQTFHAENGDQYHIQNSRVMLVMEGGKKDINESIARNFKALEQDQEVEGFDLEAEDDGPAFRTERREFPELAQGPSQEKERVRKEDALVSVYQPSLDGSRKWGVNYDGNKIQASVKDEGFLRRVSNRGITLANGDRLDVDLRIKQKWDEASQDWINEEYSIESVYNVDKAARQRDVFDSNE